MLKFALLLAITALGICFFPPSSGQMEKLKLVKPAIKFLDNIVANNSIIQSIMNRQCPFFCLHPKKIGSCLLSFGRWHFDPITMTCKHFKYGGCRGNQNRFMTKRTCKETCGLCRNHNIASLETAAATNPGCKCNYFNLGSAKGCQILIPPPEGYKCHCKYNENFSCTGTAIKCKLWEKCPINCTTKACCLNGTGKDGDCKGYPNVIPDSASAIPNSTLPPTANPASLNEIFE